MRSQASTCGAISGGRQLSLACLAAAAGLKPSPGPLLRALLQARRRPPPLLPDKGRLAPRTCSTSGSGACAVRISAPSRGLPDTDSGWEVDVPAGRQRQGRRGAGRQMRAPTEPQHACRTWRMLRDTRGPALPVRHAPQHAQHAQTEPRDVLPACPQLTRLHHTPVGDGGAGAHAALGAQGAAGADDHGAKSDGALAGGVGASGGGGARNEGVGLNHLHSCGVTERVPGR